MVIYIYYDLYRTHITNTNYTFVKTSQLKTITHLSSTFLIVFEINNERSKIINMSKLLFDQIYLKKTFNNKLKVN